MGFTDIMFYSGSVLHERDLESSDVNRDRVGDLVSQGLDPEASDYEQKVLAAQQRAQQLVGQHQDMLDRLLREYNYRKYLRCIYKRLPNYHGLYTAAYLLYKAERDVLRHARTEFHLHRPGAQWIHEDDNDEAVDRKLGRARHIGGFARTASIGKQGAYGFPGNVSYLKKTSSFCDYDVIEAGGKVPPGHKLVPVNGKETYANSSSRVLKKEMDHFVGKMLAADLGFPVFSVSDCNSFHTSGYLWSTYAIRRVRETAGDDAVAVLNFDQHNDVGDADDELVASDRWGAPAVAYLTNGIYMSFGLAASGGTGLNKEYTWQNVFVVRKNGASRTRSLNDCKNLTSGKAWNHMSAEEQVFYLIGVLSKVKGRWNSVLNQPSGATLSGLAHAAQSSILGMHQADNAPINKDALTLGGIFAELWKALGAYLQRPIKYVFVTVDRDSVQGHQTQWGDASLFPNAGALKYAVSGVVDALMAESPACRLIGLDITGLPESRVAMRKWDGNLVPAAAAWQEAENEIVQLREWGAPYADLQWRPGPSTFLDKAVPLLGSLAREVLQHNLLYGRNLPVEARGRIEALTGKLRSDQSVPMLKPRALLQEQEVRQAMIEIAKDMRLAARNTFAREAKGVFASYASRIEGLLAP